MASDPKHDVWPWLSPATPMAGRCSPAYAEAQGVTECSPQAWEVVLGTWTLGNVHTLLGKGLQWFNFKDDVGNDITTFPAGQYYIAYCRGAWIDRYQGYAGQPSDVWAVAHETATQIQLNGGNRISSQYMLAGVATQAPFNGDYTALYNSYAEACAGSSGSTTGFFTHSGGPIQMGFVDFSDPDDVNAYERNGAWVNPTYMLIQVQPWFNAGACYAAYTQAGSPRWTGYFNLQNISPVAWAAADVTIKIREPWGQATFPIDTFNLAWAAGENKVLAITFDAPAPKLDPVIEVWYQGQLLQDFQLHLSAHPACSYAYSYQNTGGPCGQCIDVFAYFVNDGNMDTSPGAQFACQANSGFTLPMQPPGCAPGGQNYVTMQLCCPAVSSSGGCANYVSVDYFFAYRTPKPSAKVEFIVTDGGVILLDQQWNV